MSLRHLKTREDSSKLTATKLTSKLIVITVGKCNQDRQLLSATIMHLCGFFASMFTCSQLVQTILAYSMNKPISFQKSGKPQGGFSGGNTESIIHHLSSMNHPEDHDAALMPQCSNDPASSGST